MGTWLAPSTEGEKAQLEQLFENLKYTYESILKIFGDDLMADAFEVIEDRIRHALETDWI